MNHLSQKKEPSKELIQQLYEEVFQKGNIALTEKLFTADFIDHSTPEQMPGPQGVAAYAIAIRVGFPDLHITIEDSIIEENKIAVRTTWSGTHRGIYEGIKPTGRRVSRTLIQIFSLIDDKIAEEWNEGSSLLSTL